MQKESIHKRRERNEDREEAERTVLNVSFETSRRYIYIEAPLEYVSVYTVMMRFRIIMISVLRETDRFEEYV